MGFGRALLGLLLGARRSEGKPPARVAGVGQFGCHRSTYSQTCVLLRRYAAQVSEYRDLWHPEILT